MQNSEFYPVQDDPYCYSGTSILKNLPDIQNPKKLENYEYTATEARMSEVVEWCCDKTIDLNLWQNIHRLLFQDVYAWAGKLRTIRLSKGSTVFAYPERIEAEGTKIFKKLADEQFLKGLDEPKLCERLAFYYNELNIIHPFREGNGRTQRLLFEEIVRKQDYKMDWAKITEDAHLEAVIEAYHGNLRLLEKIFEKVLRDF